MIGALTAIGGHPQVGEAENIGEQLLRKREHNIPEAGKRRVFFLFEGDK